MRRLTFQAFHAINNRELSERFLEGHGRVLQDYGITNITTNNKKWMDIAGVYGIVAKDEEGEIVGGIRIQMADGIHPLPVEAAISHIDKRIHDVIRKYSDNGVGELCALWNAKSVAGQGVSVLLTRAGISIANQMRCGTMVGICADYTLKMFRQVGFVVDESLGEHGEFVYPNENYIARVLGILNARNLETAEPYDRERILSLRNDPQQVFQENEGKADLEINYQLILTP